MVRRLTGKQKAFVKARLDTPKDPVGTSVMKAGYDARSSVNASKIGSELLNQSHIQSALAEYDDLFKSAIVETVRDWKGSAKPRQREIALDAAMFGFDHNHGKATAKIEQTNTLVKISINMTGDGEIGPQDHAIDLIAEPDGV